MKVRFLLLVVMSVIMAGCASDSKLLKSAQEGMGNIVGQVQSALSAESGQPGNGSPDARQQREINEWPAELKDLMAPEKRNTGGFPRVALSFREIDPVLWNPVFAELQVIDDGCMTVDARIWASASQSRMVTFKWCIPENLAYNVSLRGMDTHWARFQLGDLARMGPRRGSRTGPAVPRQMWPNEQEDNAFLGRDYNELPSINISSVTSMVAAFMVYTDFDWMELRDTRIWIEKIDRSGSGPHKQAPIPIHRL